MDSINSIVMAYIRAEAWLKSCCLTPLESKTPIKVEKRLSFTQARGKNVKLKILKNTKILSTGMEGLDYLQIILFSLLYLLIVAGNV